MLAQFAVVAAVVAARLVPPRWPRGARPALDVAAAVLAVAGLGLAVWAAVALGRAFTPFPRPAEGGQLAERGPYRLVRHPVYAGGVLAFAGFSLYASVPALAATVGLAALWVAKARFEERLLRERYPGYDAYASRVRHRFVPLGRGKPRRH